jgi:ribosomal-protein-alanine N-acetyltransferase
MAITEIACERCRLRLPAAADASSITRHANDHDIWINLRDRFPHPFTETNALEYAAHVASQPTQLAFWIDVDGAAVGGISLMPGEDVERTSTEIMTDALRGMTTYALRELGFSRVFALPFAHNSGSIRILEKVGYVREAYMRRSVIKEGRIGDQYMYGAYDDTWNG